MGTVDLHAIVTGRFAGGDIDAPSVRFSPKAPWFGGDLQTVRNFFRDSASDVGASLASHEAVRGEIDLRDGSGDRLAVLLNRPRGGWKGAVCVMLLHGLTGCEASVYMIDAARSALDIGWVPIRVNLRGGGPSSGLCRGHYHAGRTGDLDLALPGILSFAESAMGEAPRTIFAVGFSLGANLLLKYLGESGASAPFAAAAAVSPPLSLREAAVRILQRRNAIYQRYLLERMRGEILAAPCGLPAGRREAAMTARTVWAFDDKVVAPENGFADAEDYYVRCSAERYVADIAVPTLLIHAENDPWIPPTAFRRIARIRNSALRPVLTRTGGHVGFHARGMQAAWHNAAIAAFFSNPAASAASESIIRRASDRDCAEDRPR